MATTCEIAGIGTIQLWTDGSTREFAIRLSSDVKDTFRAASHLGSNYEYLICEMPIGKMDTRGWDYMLDQLAEEWGKKARESRSSATAGADRLDSSLADGIFARRALMRARKLHEKRIRPSMQCHFCKLRYLTESDREAHEKMWHLAKLQEAQRRMATSTS